MLHFGKHHFCQKLWRSFSVRDLLDTSEHSVDFIYSRAGYIYSRVRVLSLLLSVLMLAWLPIDYLLLPEQVFWVVFLLRIGMSVSFFSLGLWGHQAYSLRYAYVRLSLLILLPSLFYIISMLLLARADVSHTLTGYAHFPFLLIVIGAIFPLTLAEGFLAIFFVLFVFLGVQTALNLISFPQTLNDIWLLILLSGIALWTELTQVHILLRLYRQATRDPLTGLFNRRVLTEQLKQSIQQARRRHTKLSVMLMDLDRFKRINDVHGHLAGDAVLQTFSNFLKVHFSDAKHLVGRFGGEEFLAVLQDTDKDEAYKIANSLRNACHEAVVWDLEGEEIHFTTSIGIAELQGNEDMTSLLDRVDEYLYSAKESGRDLVVFS